MDLVWIGLVVSVLAITGYRAHESSEGDGTRVVQRGHDLYSISPAAVER